MSKQKSRKITDEWVIGLFAYPEENLGCEIFKNFYKTAIDLIQAFGFEASHISMGGKYYSGKILRDDSRKVRSAIASDFDGVNRLGVTVSPVESQSPHEDRLVDSYLFLSEPNEILFMYFSTRESVCSFKSSTYLNILLDFLELYDWDFGLSLAGSVNDDLGIYALGGSIGCSDKSKERALDRWYASSPSVRLEKLRNVYPVNIMSDSHLRLRVGDRTLDEYIRGAAGTSVERHGDLTVWHVPEGRIKSIRRDLASKGALIEVI